MKAESSVSSSNVTSLSEFAVLFQFSGLLLYPLIKLFAVLLTEGSSIPEQRSEGGSAGASRPTLPTL